MNADVIYLILVTDSNYNCGTVVRIEYVQDDVTGAFIGQILCFFFFQVSVVSIRIGFASFATLDYNASRLFPELLRVSCSLRTAIIHQQSWHKRSEKQYLERNCPAVNWREGGMCEARRAGELMSGFRGPSARQGRSMRPLQGAGRRLRDRRLRRVPLSAWPS